MAFVLIDERRSDLSDRVTGNPNVATIEVPMPSERERARSCARRRRDAWKSVSDYAGAARDAGRRMC